MTEQITVLFQAGGPMGWTPDRVERVVRDAWNRLLDMDDDPGATDADFFDLGGNSLLAVSLVESVETDLGIRVELESFFLNSSFGALVTHVQERATSARADESK